ncbi:protein of unknown function [Candidatus Promineifilum breve]|uniref:Uncharacterized protein n=1 Tax=Candidatus Promineifilum breve TaxID=1806508 RepID=A0A160T5Z2_9CHLR|nr:protein of unknown function [Candidatus Promineifilum breve]
MSNEMTNDEWQSRGAGGQGSRGAGPVPSPPGRGLGRGFFPVPSPLGRGLGRGSSSPSPLPLGEG